MKPTLLAIALLSITGLQAGAQTQPQILPSTSIKMQTGETPPPFKDLHWVNGIPITEFKEGETYAFYYFSSH